MRFNKNTFAIVFKGASCSECIEKAYEFAHKARLLNPNMNIMVLSNYSSCRVQRILEVKYDLNEGIYSVDEEAIEQFSSAYTPVVILLKSTGKVLNKEYIDDRNIVDILNELKKKSGFVK